MRLLAFLLLSTSLMALAAYDYRAYSEAKRIVTDINTVSLDLHVRGRQRYVIYQKFLSEEVDLSEYKSGSLATSTRNIPQNNQIEIQSKAAANWPSINELYLLRQKINYSISQHQSVIAADNNNRFYVVDDTQATLDLMNNLADIQNRNISLANHLSDVFLRSLTTAIIVNVGSMLTMFLIGFGFIYRDNLKETNRSLEKSQILERRHQENLQSRGLMVSVLEDLSEEKKSAERLTHMLETSNQDIKSKNQEMEQFIYTVSHDLKSPLVSIGGFSSILIRELGESLTEKQAHYLSRIQDNVSDMESMLSDLLELSRITKQGVERSSIDVNFQINSLKSSFEHELNKIGGSLTVEEPIGNVYANERQFRQCLANLISNAITYRSEGRPLEIQVCSIEESGHTTISVKDNGIGIDKKYHARVFRIFEHLDSKVGTGIGLAIVKAVMDKHQGNVYLESELDIGCTFHLKFPNEESLRKVA